LVGHWKRTVLVTACVLAVAASVVVVALYSRDERPGAKTPVAGSDAPNPGDQAAAGIQPDASASAGFGSSASPSPSTSASRPAGAAAPPPGNWPGPGNTGVPGGTKLAAYGGSCTITASGTVIEAKTVNCNLNIKATGVIIRKSKVNGFVHTDDGGKYSVTIQDTEINAGSQRFPAVAYTNVTLLRANVYGGQTTVLCVRSCNVRDSWLHGQYMPRGADWHLDAFLMNGGSNASLVHNTLDCQNPDNGCSAAVGLFGDFSPNSNVVFDTNLFVANRNQSYCAYGGSASNKPHNASGIVFRNNVFQRGSNGKCGFYGAITSFDPGRPGNAWQNNKWDDGGDLRSSL
jgi:hypothetical protein